VRVYDRVLTTEEALALSASGVAAQRARLRLAFLETNPISLITKLEAATRERDAFLASIPTVMVMKESEPPRQTHVLKRGAYDAPGDNVSAAVPAFLGSLPAGEPSNRLGLARWLVDRNNPLTARTAVNRFWAMLFGTGLVKTVEDLGSQGEWPVQQELLDWLAVEFMDSGWSTKHLLRSIVRSETYQQASNMTPELLQRDPENRLLARGPRGRLSAEMIRDQALAVSGLLVDKVGGPPVNPYQPPGLWQELQGGKGYKEDEGEGLYRRSIYSYWRRTVAPPNMVTFDAATRETCAVRENRTNTPLQALTLMNDTIYVEAARKLAERMILEGGNDPVGYGFKLVLSRSPRTSEQTTLSRARAKFASFYEANPTDAELLLSQGKSPRNASIPAPQAAVYTGIASILLNLDETVTKQ
jgi:hypothetical protein